jgi:hypothetical protein
MAQNTDDPSPGTWGFRANRDRDDVLRLRSGAFGYTGSAIQPCPILPTDPLMESAMSIHIAAQPLIALIAGILILIKPRLLNYVVAIYLIIVGLIGLLPLMR